MKHSFVGYIDEAGDEGFKFDKGSSEWFVLSCALMPKEEEPFVVKLVEDVSRLIYRRPVYPLHFRQLDHEQRLPYIDVISKSSIQSFAILVHKPSFEIEGTRYARHKFYFKVLKMLMSLISFHIHSIGEAEAEIILSNRSNMKNTDVISAFEEWQNEEETHFPIHGTVIEPRHVSVRQPRERAGLQVADAIASSFFFALQKRYEFVEPRYIHMLHPIIYLHDNRYEDYGICLCGDKTLINANSHWKWLSEVFQF